MTEVTDLILIAFAVLKAAAVVCINIFYYDGRP